MSDITLSAGATELPAGDKTAFVHHSEGGPLFGILLKNLGINSITLGFYRFWAKTHLRHFFWTNSEVFGDRFEYTGRGLELFIGFLFAVFIVLIPIGLVTNVFRTFLAADPEAQALIIAAVWLIFLTLAGIAQFRARRYRLSRTQWRGIRFFQTGNEWTYGLMYLLFISLRPITFGWITPVANCWLEGYRTNHTYFGSEKFRFDGDGSALYGAYALAWFLAWVTFGLSFFLYKARELAYIAEHSHLGAVGFRFEPGAGRVAALWFGNLMLLIFTLGLAGPFVQLRQARFVARHLEIIDAPDFAAIDQAPAGMPTIGEGLAEAIDLDGF